MRAGQLHLRFVDHFVRLRILFRILAGLVPHLLPAFQLLLRRARVELFRLDRVLRQDRHPVGQHLNKSPHHK